MTKKKTGGGKEELSRCVCFTWIVTENRLRLLLLLLSACGADARRATNDTLSALQLGLFCQYLLPLPLPLCERVEREREKKGGVRGLQRVWASARTQTHEKRKKRHNARSSFNPPLFFRWEGDCIFFYICFTSLLCVSGWRCGINWRIKSKRAQRERRESGSLAPLSSTLTNR